MAILFRCGGEEGTAGNIVTATDSWSVVNGSPTFSTSNKHSGTNSIRFNPTAASWSVRRTLATSLTTGTTFTRQYVYFASIPGTNCEILRVQSGGALNAYGLHVLTSGKIRLTNYADGSNTYDSTFTCSNSVLYRIETKDLLSNAGAGTIEVRIYIGDSLTTSDSYGDLTGDNNTFNTNVGIFYFGQASGAVTSDIYMDDFGINNDTNPGDGSNMSWCGPEKIFLISPVTIVSSEWTSSAGGNSVAANVDDIPGVSDDTTTYNTVSSVSKTDRFQHSGLGSEVPSNAVIHSVTVMGRVGSTQTGSTRFHFDLWDESGTHTTGPTGSAAVNGWKISSTGENLHYNATGKTKANVNDGNFNIGYGSFSSDTTERRVSAVWANVGWLESAGQTLAVDSGIYTIAGQAILPRTSSPLYLRYRK